MTCTHFASFAQGPVRASWLVADIPPGPRSPRTRWSSEAASGLAPITPKNWTHVGSLDIETRQAFHEAHLMGRRDALASTLAKLRADKRHSGALICEAELRAVTHELLAQGGK